VDGKAQVYRKAQGTQPQRLKLERVDGDIAGELVYQLDSGLMVFKAPDKAAPDAPALPPYRLVTPEGQDVPGGGLDAFQDLGCGFLQVRRDGKAGMLRGDGSLSPELRRPYSC